MVNSDALDNVVDEDDDAEWTLDGTNGYLFPTGKEMIIYVLIMKEEAFLPSSEEHAN